MTKQKVSEVKGEDFEWKFRILDIGPLFKQVKSGAFKRVGDGNVYICDETDPEYEANRALAEYYIHEKPEVCKIYVEEKEPLRSPPKRYAVEEGRFMVYESKLKVEDGKEIWAERGRSITDDFYIALDEDVEFDDGIEKVHKYRGRIIVNNGANEFKFDVDSRLFATSQDMAKTLSNIGGAKVVFDNSQLKDIRIAMQITSEYEMKKVSQIFGWQSKKVYQSQSAMIFPGIVKAGDSNVDLTGIKHAENLDIYAITDKEFKKVGEHICKDLLFVHERYPIDCLLGFTFLAPIASRIVNSKKWSGGRIGMWIVGSTTCGKSHTSLLFQNFFGDFVGENSTFGWGGTPFSIQDGGYYFKDAIFMVDDFKISAISHHAIPTVISILQNYTDGTSRTRLDSDMHVSSGKPIRGSLLITGEDLLDDVGSIMNRYHIVRMDEIYMNPKAFDLTKDYVGLYSGFMGRYIAWLLKDPKSVEKIVDRIERWKRELMAQYEGININRIAQSFTYNLVGFSTFCQFLADSGFISMEKQIEMVKIHKNNLFLRIGEDVIAAKDATVSEVFINTLKDLINSGAVKIHEVSKDKPDISDFRDEYIGFDDFDEYLYFWGIPVWNAVNKAAGLGRGLMNSKTNLLNELVKRGIMMPGTQGNTFNKLLYGKTQGTWKISKIALGYGRDDVAAILSEEITEEDMAGW